MDTYKNTPMHLAVQSNYSGFVELLLENVAIIGVVNSEGGDVITASHTI